MTMRLDNQLVSRRSLLNLTVGTGTLLFVACGAPAAAPTQPAQKPVEKGETAPKAPAAQPKAGGPVTVTYLYPNWGSQELYMNLHADVTKLFQERWSGQYQIAIDVVSGSFDDRLFAQFAANQQPAAFWVDHQLIAAYVKQNLLEDLNPFAKADASFPANEMHPVAMNALTIGGKLYGLAGASFVGGIYYNTKLFADAGLPTPFELYRQGKWNWDTFLESAKKITKSDKSIMGVAASLNPHGTPRLWLGTNGTLEVDDLRFPTKSFYDSPKAIEAVQFHQDLLLKHQVADPQFEGVPAGGVAQHPGQPIMDQFKAGKVGMIFRYSNNMPTFAGALFDWGLLPFPKGPQGDNPVAEFTFWAYGMASGLKDERVKQGAWEWLKLFNGKEGQRIMGGKHLISIPYVSEVFAEWSAGVKSRGWRLEHHETIPEMRDKYPNQRLMAPNTPDLWGIIRKVVAEVWLGKKNAREGCLEIAQMMNEFLRQNPQKIG